MFDFNKEAAVSTFTTATGLTNPVITAKSTLGSLIGAGLGNYIAGNTGSLIGGLVGGLVGIPKVQKSKLASKNNDIGKPLYGIENQEQAIANA
jgi:outer membrane lipoprotein SlyB